MFSIGFWELIVIATIALVILGPERLPQVATTVGRWVGRARSMAQAFQAQLRAEFEHERIERERKARLDAEQPNDNPDA